MTRRYPPLAEPTHTIRALSHDLCKSCGRYAYSTRENYCMSCGWSDANPIFGVLRLVIIGILVLAAVGWLMS